MIYLRNKDQQDAQYFFLIYFNKYPLHVSSSLTLRHQQLFYCIFSIHRASALIVLAASI